MSKKKKPKQYDVAAEPCLTCPYRCDTPRGIWGRAEYEKLPLFDTNEDMSTFLCHQSTEDKVLLCRGWLTVHCDSVAVRLLMAKERVSPKVVYRKVKTALYRTGREAMLAGVSAIRRPGRKAREAISKMTARREKHPLPPGVGKP